MQAYLYWLLIVYLLAAPLWPQLGILALICMLGPVVLSFWRGRFWCGHYCPRGSLNDHVVGRFSARHPMPRLLKLAWWRGSVLVFIIMMFSVQLYFAWGSLAGVGWVFIRLVAVTTVIGIILGIIYQPRAWCAFCPMGTLAALVSRQRRIEGAGLAAAGCVACGACASQCPLGLAAYKGQEMADCLHCGRCVRACPQQVLALGKGRRAAD
jgi:polyferredoxin